MRSCSKRKRCLTPLPTNAGRASNPQAPKPPTPTIGTPIPLSTFWNGGSTQAVRSTSRPTPTLSGTRNSGKRPLTNRRFFTTPTRRSSSRKSLTRCRRSGSSVTAERKRARAVCFPAWFTVPTAERKCGTAPTITLRSGRITLYAPTTEATQEAVRLTSSGRLCWKIWSGCT